MSDVISIFMGSLFLNTQIWLTVSTAFGIVMIKFGTLKIKFHDTTALTACSAHSAKIKVIYTISTPLKYFFFNEISLKIREKCKINT